jgi:energy-coupling factor transporter ATP-binding protein EcfA2
MGISWEKIEDKNCIGRKYIDLSMFKYGIHIPLEYRAGFLSNVQGNKVELGKSQNIKLIFDDYIGECEIRNINSKARSETIQIRYDSNKKLREYLQKKFEYTYTLSNEENQSETDEYIDIFKSEEENSFYIKLHIHKYFKLDEEAIKFINTIKTTSMSKSYKIPLLWAFYNNGNMKLKIDEDDIYKSFENFYSKEENEIDLQSQKSTEGYENWSKKEYVKLAKDKPIKYLSEGKEGYFYKENDLFCISEDIQPYIDQIDFKIAFKQAIEGLASKYYKRNINNDTKVVKERDEEYMRIKELIEAFEKEYDSNNEKEDKLREEFIEKFPIDSLESLELERYALGKKADNLCWWLEYNTIPLGSIKGGNAKKFKIYFASKENKWIYPNQFETVDQAWDELRSSIYNFINNFRLGNYEELNKDSLVSSMNMFKTKLIYMYFPDKLLPVYSLDHIHKLLIYFGYEPTDVYSLDIINANMKLKKFQDNSEDFKYWDGLKFMRFLYYKVFHQMNMEDIVEELTDIDNSEALNHINDYIKNQGYTYTHEQLSNLYLSLKTKPFVILAGISGTGKSKIVRLLAESLGATSENNQFNMISVRPDWNDSTELIGYKNLEDKFIQGYLTKIIQKANDNKNKPYFICLDEMNLARVEYYLSDYLSIIESRKKVGQDIITDNLIEDETILKNTKLNIPDNLYLIGTVNMDDTTFQFSRKVLDRANTIEFSDVDLENLFGETTDEDVKPLDVSNEFLKTTYLKTLDIEEDHREYAKTINKKIIQINEILKKSQKQFAYRVRDEILFYMIENKKSDLLEEDVAFDYQIMQKILPSITGSESSVEQVLIDLFNFICDKPVISGADIEEAENYLQKENVGYKNSAEKIIYMLKGYSNYGYVSYWY